MFNGADLRSIFLLAPDAQNNDRLVEQNITRDVGPGDPVADFFRRPDVRRLGARADPSVGIVSSV